MSSSIHEVTEFLGSICFEKRIVNYFYGRALLSFSSSRPILTHQTMLVVSGTAFFIYECLITFDAEVNLVWKSPWNPTKLLFLMNRYIPFLNAVTILLHQFLQVSADSRCKYRAIVSSCFFVVGCGIADIILALRTWAIWRKSKRVGIFLFAFLVLSWAGICFCVESALQQATFFSHPKYGCVISNLNRSMSITFGVIALYDLVLLAAIVINLPLTRSTFLSVFSGTSSLSQVTCRDALSIINLILVLQLKRQYQLLVVPFESVMRSALTSRVVLNIRSEASKTTIISSLDNDSSCVIVY
ncbi:hypothetical protein AGABI2DRAFT_142657 [Agaricus bisporus var. bisporus H97]|uniref:hypothetical protein n=1 Tax=Agaricus bisporus var. bisporus (strain H97 / ATCC MYA-4626 / FGSC 10389) TaxID=936046 RepID=UPI00029F64A8|nr:hypothetical protein AGABI2DRAFT_142657 [Agaricus bisporus var. bisporus H97]EKV48562.1 hypothetical protein AGABI2DRAFT_142657 [Agaricus bisporus var. bisporus H97]